MNYDLLFDTIGTIGVVCILIAFFLVQTEKLTANCLTYPVLNLVGAVLLLISLMWSWNTPSVIIEIAWISISIYGIVKITAKRRQKEQDNAEE